MVKEKALGLFGVCAMMSILLFGCSALNASSDSDRADDCANMLIDALARGDARRLDNLFSDNLRETLDTEDLIRCSRDSLGLGNVRVEAGPKSKQKEYLKGKMARSITAYYDIFSETGSYVLYMEFYPYNSIDPRKEGVNKLFFGTEEEFSEIVWDG